MMTARSPAGDSNIGWLGLVTIFMLISELEASCPKRSDNFLTRPEGT